MLNISDDVTTCRRSSIVRTVAKDNTGLRRKVRPASSGVTVLEKSFDEALVVRGRCDRMLGRLVGVCDAGAATAGSLQPRGENRRRVRAGLVQDPERTLRSRWAAALPQAASARLWLWLSTTAPSSGLRLSAAAPARLSAAALVSIDRLHDIEGPPGQVAPLLFRGHRASRR